MAKPDQSVYYILNAPIAPGSASVDPEDIHPGSLWVALRGRRLQKDGHSNCCLDWQEGAFEELDPEEYDLLRAVGRDEDRIGIYRDRDWLEEGRCLTLNDEVCVVNIPDLEGVTGRVRVKGRLDDRRPGILFGIELDERYAGRGTSDGTFRKKRHFACGKNCAVFYSLKCFRRRRRPEEESYRSALDLRSRDHPLILDARVVWPSDGGPEYGRVRWLGRLPDLDQSDGLYAGVEFDNPIGRGRGRYRGKRLFTCARDHASLVPVAGLMLAEDYDSGSLAGSRQSGVTALARSDPEGARRGEPDGEVKVGDRVVVRVRSRPLYGVIRWIGSSRSGLKMAGVEMDDADPACYTTGSFENQVKFECQGQGQRAFFVGLSKCRRVRIEADQEPGITE